MQRIRGSLRARIVRGMLILGMLALLGGLVGGMARYAAPASAQGGRPAASSRQVFLPLVTNGTAASLESSDVSFSLALSPANQVAPGELLRATITAHNGSSAATLKSVTVRYRADQLSYERVEGNGVLAVGQSGDYTTMAFRNLASGETRTGTLLLRVARGLADGTAITVTPEYFCPSGLCYANEGQVQVRASGGSTAGTDEHQELLVAPASGGTSTVFRFSSRKFPARDRVELWLSDATGGPRRLPQQYTVGADGWLRFELDGSTFGVGSWNLMAYGGLSGFSSVAGLTVSASTAAVTAPLAAAGPSLGAVAASPAPAASPAQTGEGGVAGKVTDATSGAGLADVLVVVSQNNLPVTSALTDADGSYLIPVGLASGSYTLKALAASAGVALGYQDATYPQPVTVAEPDLTSGVNFALERGGNIAGRVTANDTRSALAGVAVEVLDAGDVVVAAAATDAEGSYQVEGLAEGSYTLRFSPHTGADGSVIVYAEATVAAVAVTAGGTVFVDQGLDLQPTLASIRGRVSGKAGGLADVLVATLDAQGKLVDLTLSAADGTYATGPLAPGSYRIAYLTYFANDSTTRRYVSAVAAVDIAAAGVVQNNIKLALGITIAGTVRGAGNAALAGVIVAAYDANGAVQAVAASDANGAYTLGGLAAGSYRVGFFADYADDATVRRYQDSFYNGAASLGAATPIDATTAGTTVTGIDASLTLGGSIAGKVTGAGGAGLAGVVVLAFNADGAISAVALSGADGSYQTPGLAPGSYTLLFDTIFAPTAASRGYIDEYFDDRAAPPYTPVVVTAGATASASASLAHGGQIAGRVTAADTGLGLSGVAVLVYDGSTLVSFTMSDASGAYTTAGLPAGSYSLQFDPTGSADEETALYAAQARAGAVAVTVGAVTPGADVALARP